MEEDPLSVGAQTPHAAGHPGYRRCRAQGEKPPAGTPQTRRGGPRFIRWTGSRLPRLGEPPPTQECAVARNPGRCVLEEGPRAPAEARSTQPSQEGPGLLSLRVWSLQSEEQALRPERW